MGSSISTNKPASIMSLSSSLSTCQCDNGSNSGGVDGSTAPQSTSSDIAPPTMHRPQSFEEKAWEKFRKQPLVPIGCAATAYFLASGIKSFQRQDPRRGQKMMRARVAAQFATLGVFMWYIGFDRINFGIAPQYHAAKRAREEYAQQMEREGKN